MTVYVSCPGCCRTVGTYANGKIRPHYAVAGPVLCSGSYLIPDAAPTLASLAGGVSPAVASCAARADAGAGAPLDLPHSAASGGAI